MKSLKSRRRAANISGHLAVPLRWLQESVVPDHLSARTFVLNLIRVADGDKIAVLGATNTQYRIRLEGIDAPESRQAFGTQSKKSLSDMVFARYVTVV